MPTSATILREDGLSGERRSQTREALKWVILAYFCENNWGKLLNMNESGMCLEFAEAPRMGERISFTLEAMGRMPAPFGGEIVSETFQAAGEIQWTREFERTAGVRFTELAEESREEIRRWLSFEASSTVTRSDEARREAPAPQAELSEPAGISTEDHREKAKAGESASAWEKAESRVEPVGTREPDPVAKILEAPAFQDYSKLLADEERKHEPVSGLQKSRLIRMRVMAASGCLVLLAGVAVARMILPVWARRSEAAEGIPGRLVNDSEPRSAKYGSDARNPFLVEVQDAENRRWLLWFVNKTAMTTAAHRSALPSTPVLPAKSTGRTRQPASAKSKLAREFTWIAPPVNRARANHSSENVVSNAAPVVPLEAPPLEAAVGSILAKRPAPVPVGQPLPVGGEVQEARLIKSVPPVYPRLAKANHVTGDVALDALIDNRGNVTDVKVVSGPTLLREAAMDALRSWKYEPARLDGRAVAAHLSITVKFRFQ
jgi:TonB family protein